MLAIKGCWAGQTFALPTNNDTGGKRSRSRCSKEERKIMVESFINKYQKSNNGNFPSLNLTQKEVGGSFYTVREIFREIIQENRVLASPKVSLDEHNHSRFLEKHRLGSISVENDALVSDKHNFVTPTEPNEYQITSEELVSISSDEFGNEKIVDVGGGLEENINSDKHSTTTAVIINHQDGNNEAADLSSQEIHVLGSQRLADEQNLSKNNQIVGKTKESGEEIYTESVVISEKDGGRDVEVSEANLDVETFPLRPACGMILDLDGETGKWDEANKHDKTIVFKSNSLVDEKDIEHSQDLTMELTCERKDGKVVQNLQEPSFENSKVSSSLHDETEAHSSTQRSISEAFVTKSRAQDETVLEEGNNLMLERLNLETWKRTSKKSTRLEHNPLLTFVKTVISVFVKFWTKLDLSRWKEKKSARWKSRRSRVFKENSNSISWDGVVLGSKEETISDVGCQEDGRLRCKGTQITELKLQPIENGHVARKDEAPAH